MNLLVMIVSGKIWVAWPFKRNGAIGRRESLNGVENITPGSRALVMHSQQMLIAVVSVVVLDRWIAHIGVLVADPVEDLCRPVHLLPLVTVTSSSLMGQMVVEVGMGEDL